MCEVGGMWPGTVRDAEQVICDQSWNIHARGRDAVAEFHRVVDLVHEIPAAGTFEEIDRDDVTLDGSRGPTRDVGKSSIDRESCGRCAARGVRWCA
jgi:hypothetical protein